MKNKKTIITKIFVTLFIFASGLVLAGQLSGCQLLDLAQNPPSVSQEGALNLYGTDPHTLDPAVSGDATSHEYIMQIFGGLLSLDDDLKPGPDIAEKWEVHDDGMTYTFYLRKDVDFHDGRNVKAEDFKFSWERAASPETGSLTASTYLGDIVGVKDVLAGESQEISGVRILDDYTLEVTIDAPKSYFLSKLTYPTTFVVDRNNTASGETWWQKPNGTGPFKLQEWLEESRLVLERNDDYYGQVAKLDTVVFQFLSGVPMNLYETGRIDVSGTSISYIDRVQDEAGPFYTQLVTAPELSFYYIGFDTTGPPFDDTNIRRAFTQAINRQKLTSLVFRGMVQSAEGILPPGIPGYNENLAGLKFDIEKAKELIKLSSYSSVDNLPPITLTTVGYGGLISGELEAIIHQWRENLGVEVTVRQLEPERFLYNLKEEKDQMFDMGWVADYPHPQDFLEILFRSESETNYGEYSNAEVDDLLERAGLEMDNDRSLALYREAEQKLVDDAACLPLWFGRNFVLIKPYVKGYDLNPMGLVKLNEVSLEPR